MPYPLHIVESFKKKYGKNWKQRFFAWKNANPGEFSKALATSRRRKDPIIQHSEYADSQKKMRKGLKK